MKLCRFNDDRVGLVRDDLVFDITAPAERAIFVDGHGRSGDPLVACLAGLRDGLPADLGTCPRRPLNEVQLLSPVRSPGKIVAAPVNYRAHIAEMAASNVSPGHSIPDIDRAGLFLKATSSLVGPSQGIALRFPERRTDYEIELVAVIGKTASEVSRAGALDYVAGFCLGLDITIRGTEDRSFRKSVDSYTVLGPWLTTPDEVADPNDLRIQLRQNGELRQNGHTADLIFGVERLIEFASSFYTLHPGDIVFTGTPDGVGPIRPGDRLNAACDALGSMDVLVREHRRPA